MLALLFAAQLFSTAAGAEALRRPVQDLSGYEIAPEPTPSAAEPAEFEQVAAERTAHALQAQKLAAQFANPLDAITEESLRNADFARWGVLQAPAQRLVQDAEFRKALLTLLRYPDFATLGWIELGTLIVYWAFRAWRLRRAITVRARFWVRAKTFVFFNGLLFLGIPIAYFGEPALVILLAIGREILHGFGAV